MAQAGNDGCEDLITIKIKTTRDTLELRVNKDATVQDVKDQLTPKFNAPVEQLCLIFSGKILKDNETLKQHGIGDGLTIHLVVRAGARTQAQPAGTGAQATPTSSSSTSSGASSGAPGTNTAPNAQSAMFGNLFGAGGLPNWDFGMGSDNFADMHQRVQQQLLTNPESLRNAFENPIVQSLMNNPEFFRTVMMSNRQLQQLIERNPEIGHLLNNPELLRQTMDMIRNPAAFQELMRSHDRAVSNLESIPGGMAALQRLYRDVQEPIMNATQEHLGPSNPFATLVTDGNNTTGSQSTNAGVENREPLPNPWAPRTATRQQRPTSTPGGQQQSTNNTGSNINSEILNSPGMQSLFQQLGNNSQLMQNILQAPYMQSMMQSMASNPDMASQFLNSHPLLESNPQLREQMARAFPQMLQQMSDPSMMQAMTNPRVLQALMQIQQAMEVINREAPGLLTPSAGFLDMMGNPGATSSAAGTQPVSAPNAQPAQPSATASTDSRPQQTQQQQQQQLGRFMATLIQQMASSSLANNQQPQNQQNQQNQQPPEERYRAQLEQLAGMGFVNRDANIRALTLAFGDVNAAIEHLLNQQGRNLP